MDNEDKFGGFEAVELVEAAKKRGPAGASPKTKTWRVNVVAKGTGGRVELISAVNRHEARQIANSRFGKDSIGSVNQAQKQHTGD